MADCGVLAKTRKRWARLLSELAGLRRSLHAREPKSGGLGVALSTLFYKCLPCRLVRPLQDIHPLLCIHCVSLPHDLSVWHGCLLLQRRLNALLAQRMRYASGPKTRAFVLNGTRGARCEFYLMVTGRGLRSIWLSPNLEQVCASFDRIVTGFLPPAQRDLNGN